MESPINPNLWKVLFNAAIGTLSAVSLYSIYHQRYDMQSTVRSTFRSLAAARKSEERLSILSDLQSNLRADAVSRKPAIRLSALKHGQVLIELAKLEKDGQNSDIVSSVVKLILNIYGPDAAGRRRLNDLGGYQVLLSTLSEAHRQGNTELMEDVAAALDTLTEVDDGAVVLDTDVPEGCEGAALLASKPAVVKMLRILDPEGSLTFLTSITGIFANLCTLNAGAVKIGAGTDGHSGISYFLQLMDHANRRVVTNCVTTVRFLARASVGQEELTQSKNITRLADNLLVSGEPAIVNSILTIILVMAGSRAYGEAFFAGVATSTIPKTLFELWIRSPEKALRSRAEVLCRLLLRLPQTASAVAMLFERNRVLIEERRRKDEEEYKQQMQQMQQNQMMQRLMMEQMGMDPSMMG